MNGVSILVPTLDEAGNIEALLDRIAAAVEGPHEVLVIDAESTDGTQELVRARDDARLLQQTSRDEGLIGAILDGTRAAQYDAVVVLDADLSHPPETCRCPNWPWGLCP